MSNPIFDHEIYRIAHPVMQKLVYQAVKVREFQAIFPNLYSELVRIRAVILRELIDLLTEKYKERTSLDAEKIRHEILTIVVDRQLLNHVMGYCQTKELITEDIFLLNRLLEPNELRSIFEQLYSIFWEYIQKYEEFTQLPNFSTNFKAVLNQKYFLPDLLPLWDIKSLFLDYLKVYIQYHNFKNSKDVKGTNITREPTDKEAYGVLKRLKTYDIPLQKSTKSFIGNSTLDPNPLSSNFINLHLHLEEDIRNIPALLSKFIHQFMSTRIDYERKGTDAQIVIENNLREKIHNLSIILDDCTNSLEVLKRADAILTALISLIYYDEVFETKIIKGNIQAFESANYCKLVINEVHDPANQTILANSINTARSDSVNHTGSDHFSNLFNTLYELLEKDEDIEIIETKKPTTFITCHMRDTLYEHVFSKASLSKGLDAMVGKLSLELAEIINL